MSTNTIHMIPTRLFIMSLWRHVRLISPLLRGLPIPQCCLAPATRLSLFPSCNTQKNAYVSYVCTGRGTPSRECICITTPAWYFHLRAGTEISDGAERMSGNLSGDSSERARRNDCKACTFREGEEKQRTNVSQGRDFFWIIIIFFYHFFSESWRGHLGFDTAFRIINFAWWDVSVE